MSKTPTIIALCSIATPFLILGSIFFEREDRKKQKEINADTRKAIDELTARTEAMEVKNNAFTERLKQHASPQLSR